MAKLSLKIFLWLILPLLCVEFLMIVLDPYLFKGFQQYDPDLGFRIRAHYPSFDGNLTNQFGFNDRDYPLQKTPGTFRIVVVGDSFGWAGGREGNYTALLERKLENYHGGHKIDVINTGYLGTHTGEQLAMLKKYGLQYNPDLLILGFFAGNDFFEADPERRQIVVNDLYIRIRKNREHSLLGYPLVPQTRLFLFIKQKYKIYAEFRKAEREARRSAQQGQRGTFSEERFLKIERKRLEFFNSRERRFQAHIDNIFQSISEMDALLKSRNIKFVVAIYPDEFQVNGNLLKAIFEKYRLRQEDYDLDLAQNLLKSFLESKGIPYIDLSARFRAEGKIRDLYLFRDTHWNDAGNQLAAGILFEDLVKRVGNMNPSR